MTGATWGSWPTPGAPVDVAVCNDVYNLVYLYEDNFIRRFLFADYIPLYEWQMHEQRELLMERLSDLIAAAQRKAA